MKFEPYIYDIESYGNFFCCTFLSLRSDDSKLFIIDEDRNDAEALVKVIKGKYLIGYNNKNYDNVVINCIANNQKITAERIFEFSDGLIKSMNKGDHRSLYLQYGKYMHSDDYKYIDLMRMLFSKKLRVSLKELECSLNFKNVEELPYPIGSILTQEQKGRVVLYNFNDCEATKEVAIRSLKDIKLRKWTQKRFGVDVYSLDGVNLGVKILEKKLAEKLGNSDFTQKKT